MDHRAERGIPIPNGAKRLPMPKVGPVDPPPEGGDKIRIEMGPSHPAMHGTIKMNVLLDGETVERVDVEPGYLHRGFEKSCEAATWSQIFPYTDRLNYVSPLINNNCYASAVEKLCGIEIPERAKYCRTIAAELSRLSDHLTCVGASAMELGGFTAMLYLIEARDTVWDAIEELSGARLTVAYARIGGVVADLPPDFEAHTRTKLARLHQLINDTDQLLRTNKIFINRTRDVGVISAQEAVDWGWTGPCLRSTGIGYDVRRAAPYDVYDRLDFEVPVGERGDNYDRYLVRIHEMRESIRMLEQCFDQIKDTPPAIMVDDPRYRLPEKAGVHTAIEQLMNHFKIVIDGIQVPEGEAYAYQEGGNGELGFYLVSTGAGRPWKIRVRPPSFMMTASLPVILEGGLIADIVPTFGSVNMIGGECDR